MIIIGLETFKYHPEVAMFLEGAQVLFIFASFKCFYLDLLGSKSKAPISSLGIVVILHGQVIVCITSSSLSLKVSIFKEREGGPKENTFVQGPKTLSNALCVDSESCL